MLKKVVPLALLFMLVSSTTALAQNDKLGLLIANLYGEAGLFVQSEANLPPPCSPCTHSAHFNSAFQGDFTQFNIALATQLSSLPLPSPASGFTYEFDAAIGAFTRTTQSFGPILAERAEPSVKGNSRSASAFSTSASTPLRDRTWMRYRRSSPTTARRQEARPMWSPP